jgi:XTP/dITP diphosphohydrolase
MKKIIFASGNKGKIAEVKRILGELDIPILSLHDINFKGEIVEDGDSFEENAKIKAIEIFNSYKLPTIADDSGLVVEQLNGEPGIYSARYAGIDSDDEANNIKLLENLSTKPEPGFGYDPLFVPDGYAKTMAELDPEIKNSISHRFKAFDQLKKYLLSI